jgi:hypothetical protein
MSTAVLSNRKSEAITKAEKHFNKTWEEIKGCGWIIHKVEVTPIARKEHTRQKSSI